LSPLLVVTPDSLYHGISVFEQSRRLGAFDAVLAATALIAGVDTLASADASFASVGELHHVAPDAAGVQALLAQKAGDSR
jgi:hypothetical protein